MPRNNTPVNWRWGLFALSIATCLVLLLHPRDMDVAQLTDTVRLRMGVALAISLVSPTVLPISWAGRIMLVICCPIALFFLVCAGVCAWSMYHGTIMGGIQ